MRKPKRFLIILIATFALVALYLVSGSNIVPKADATGGAFTDTKHGGGTVDGEPHSGIDRSVNPENFPYYNSDEAGAGKYQSGECSHCHEPHSSFGGDGTDPLPAGGPTAYILMESSYNSATEGEDSKLCWYCHEEINWDPFFGGGIGRWKFYQGQSLYELSGHATASTSFAWPGTGGGEVFPRRDRSGYAAANDESCVNCHTPHGVGGTGVDIGAQTTANYTANAAEPTPDLVQRQLIAREEALCLRCHDAGGPAGADIHTEINKRVNDTTADNTFASGHAVRSYFQKHNLNAEDDFSRVSGWNSANWHVECTDCHNPHRATKGPIDGTKAYSFQRSGKAFIGDYNTNRGGASTTAGQVEISDANLGVWGITVTDADATPYSVTYGAIKDEPDYVYELCLKCHSVFGGALDNLAPSTTRDATLKKGRIINEAFTDVGIEFDPDNCLSGNGAIHPLFAKGCNQPPTGANSAWTGAGRRADIPTSDDLSQNFVPPWTKDSFVTCIDCHRGDATGPYGPHGSTSPFILARLDTTITYDICTDAGPGVCTGTETVDYNTWDAGGGTGGELKTDDPANLCLNCHRADIYGFQDQASYPNNNSFARLNHPADGAPPNSSGGGQSFTTGDPPRGIVCLRCHGGRILGGIHGIDTSVARGQASDGVTLVDTGIRFLYGETWQGYTAATTAGNEGLCGRTKVTPDLSGENFNSCGQHADGGGSAEFGNSNYDYFGSP